MVALTEGMPPTRGRQWTAEDYATRDAVLSRLGIQPFTRRTTDNGRQEG
jgi:hypothetical protein